MPRFEEFVGRALPSLRDLVDRVEPGGRVVDVVPLAPDKEDATDALKTAGYGVPLRIVVETPSGGQRRLVLHTATSNVFGHDRRADRAAEMLLGFDTFNAIPRHVKALDVGAFHRSGGLVSLHDAGEFYLVTEYADGEVYAEDLRRIARESACTNAELARVDLLAKYLVGLHAERAGNAEVYRRAARDLVGSGEGIAGIVDGYPDGVPGASSDRLERLVEACTRRRYALRRHETRCARIHGDFHPWNILFDPSGELVLLDASRGSAGDPADDVTCLAINFVFFGVEHPAAWRPALSKLWYRFWDTYLTHSADGVLLDVVGPFLAWRGLVVANPVWYPNVSVEARGAVLSFIEAAVAAPRFDPHAAEVLFP